VEAVRAGEGAFPYRPDGTATAELVVLARGVEPRLAWEVVVGGERPDGTPSEWHVFVDARTAAVLEQWDGVQVSAGVGTGFFVGAVPLETTPVSGGYSLKDPLRGNTYTIDMLNKKNGGTLFTDADNVWGDGTLANRQTVGVDAQFGVAMTWDYFLVVHGRTGIANDGRGAYNRVHYGRNYNNAFWSESCFCMTYGDGDGVTFNPFTSLDVAGHEMSHGVTSRTAALVYSGESGGLNEATSDIFGTMVEYYADNAQDVPDYTIGEELYRSGTTALRYMYRPSLDGRSPDCWSSTLASLDVHYSSGPANHFFYLLAEGTAPAGLPASPTCNGTSLGGIGRARAERIWYRALAVYMTSSTNYAGARAATLSAAADLFGPGSAEVAAVAAAWSGVSVN
jgi:Zn-dependent metalloprotease